VQVDDFYALLGVTPAAGAREIRAAFRQLAKRLHPDVSRLPSAADRFRRVMAAYETLSDPARRAAYDATYRPAASAQRQRPTAPTGTYSPTGFHVEPDPDPAPAEQHPPRSRTPAVRAPTPKAPGPATKRPSRPRGPTTPVTPIAPVGAVGTLSPGERARRTAEAIRAAAVRVRCVECGALVSGDSDRCPSCLRKYGTFQEHLARAVARAVARARR
jgi:curved DNA-binding protein CbpA